MVDVSGSVDRTVMQRFSNEIDRILKTLRTQVFLIVGDDCVRFECQLKPGVQALRDIQFDGGGGTNFEPMISAADKHKPDIGVYLTDLDGPVGAAPQWPILWAVPIDNGTIPPPFGERVLLD